MTRMPQKLPSSEPQRYSIEESLPVLVFWKHRGSGRMKFHIVPIHTMITSRRGGVGVACPGHGARRARGWRPRGRSVPAVASPGPPPWQCRAPMTSGNAIEGIDHQPTQGRARAGDGAGLTPGSSRLVPGATRPGEPTTQLRSGPVAVAFQTESAGMAATSSVVSA